MADYKVKVVTAEDGTVSATVEERNMVEAVMDTITAKLSNDEASVGYTSSIVDGALLYGGMLFAKYRQTSRFSWNPL